MSSVSLDTARDEQPEAPASLPTHQHRHDQLNDSAGSTLNKRSSVDPGSGAVSRLGESRYRVGVAVDGTEVLIGPRLPLRVLRARHHCLDGGVNVD